MIEKKREKKDNRKKRSSQKRITAVLLTFVMLIACLGGCGSHSVTEGSETGAETDSNRAGVEEPGRAEAPKDGGTQTEENTAMGRYVEKVTDLSEEIAGYENGLFRLADGNLVIVDPYNTFFISKDNGETWEKDKREWHSRLVQEGVYFYCLTVGADNTVVAIYAEYGADEETSAQQDESEAAVAEAAGDDAVVPDMKVKVAIFKPDGTAIPVEIPLKEGETHPYQAYIADNGRMFVTVLSSDRIFEIKEDGSSEVFLTMGEGSPDLIQFQGNLMIMDDVGAGRAYIYDMEKEEYVEDSVWNNFLKENYKNRYSNGTVWYDTYFFAGEENVLYLAGDVGLHRHAIGGSVMEQVIDGNLSTFGNPSYQICGMVSLENNEFMTLFTNGRLVRYVYDPDIATVPSERLKVYSLRDNNTIRQAITLYQGANPEVYVAYEIGMDGNSAITREDALKNLNTRIMAGEGPDVLILDEMPLRSYIEKGLLQDLTETINDCNSGEALFTNIVDACRTGDAIYAMPCEVQIPVMLGDKKYLSKIKDLESMADTIEEVRMDNPEKGILYLCSEKGILRFFAMLSAPAWITEDGEADMRKIEEYLVQAKRIYDAEMGGTPEELITRYKETSANSFYNGSKEDSKYLRSGINEVLYLMGDTQLQCGTLNYEDAYATISSVNRGKGFEDSDWIPMAGQCSNVFCAQTLLGISAASQYTEQAQDFIRICLGKENQTYLFNGYTVNREAFAEYFVYDEGDIEADGSYQSVMAGSPDGEFISLPVYPVDKQQADRLKKLMETVDTPYIEDPVLEYAVYEEGIPYLQGTKELSETMDAIERRVSIYMAE